MNLLTITSKKRESYKVQLESSLLWESALGIAAITNASILDTLEKKNEFELQKEKMPAELCTELDYVQKNNTWKCLLQLLHTFQSQSSDLHDFTSYIEELLDEKLKYICLPYIGEAYLELRRLAVHGDNDSMRTLMQLTKENSFFPSYIQFICTVNPVELKQHLILVMSLWYETVIAPVSTEILSILNRDTRQKEKMMRTIPSEEFVEWATGGITYSPEPNVQNVLLIPQLTYRPWNVESDIEDSKVFYYPVSDDSIHPDDAYRPPYLLVQKHKALGDEVRLRIIKHLYEKDSTLQEITESLELGKSTVHHHLKLLRAASLVNIRSAKYHLKTQALQTLSQELLLYVTKRS
ncbi:ArsR/SmtB family transcription factor [Brevibacillus daliensis]|uniref:ArsR/SmtB family transcription factor n=1 Tax=Brevibacillus daliensis TaxID=2892995 RepID=UPI001E5347BE|nr:helix-turn-helix domain-containing protein [Brevibacillus daliensis]